MWQRFRNRRWRSEETAHQEASGSLMGGKRSMSLEAVRASLNIECPHCHHSITPAERMHIDTEHIRCPKCQKEFVPKGPEKPIRTG